MTIRLYLRYNPLYIMVERPNIGNRLRLVLAAGALTAAVVGGIGIDNRAHAQEFKPTPTPTIEQQQASDDSLDRTMAILGSIFITGAFGTLITFTIAADRERKRRHERVMAGKSAEV